MKPWLAVGLSMIASMGCGSTPDSIPANDDAGPDADALVDARAAVTTETGVPGPTRYPYGPSHSPLTADVVARLRAIVSASPHRKDVFAKVGASNTVNVCVARADKVLDIDATSGSHRLVVDTFVSSGVPRSGGFRLTLVARE